MFSYIQGTFEEKLQSIEKFLQENNTYDQIFLLKKHSPFFLSQGTQDQLVQGCQSQVWINCKKENNELIFLTKSDSILVEGISLILCYLYSSSITIFPSLPFTKEFSFSTLFSTNRVFGIKAIQKKILLEGLKCL